MTALDGYFINLDRSADRAAWMHGELRARGLDFVRRFSAIDARTLTRPAACAIPMAAYGCFLSHQAVITGAPAESRTLIFEDDVQISEDLASFLSPQNLIALDDYDMVFLECSAGRDLNTLVELYRSALRAFPNLLNPDCPRPQRRQAPAVGLHPANWLYGWGATAYLVTPRGKRRLAPRLAETLSRGPPGPIDILYRDLIEAGTLKAAITVPFLATPTLEGLRASTIDGHDEASVRAALHNMIRRLFFAGPVDGITEFLEPILPGPFPEDDAELMAKLIGHAIVGLLRDDKFSIFPQ